MSIEERVRFFEFVKNIPYKIGLYPDDPDYCCSSKAAILEKLLQGVGLQTRQIICTFDWDETTIPANILSLPRDEGETHLYLQVLIPETGKWVNCDPTWDRDLVRGGFSIAAWDGLTDTICAVKQHHIYTAEETQDLMKEYSDPGFIRAHLDHHRGFYGAINRWMHSLRGHSNV